MTEIRFFVAMEPQGKQRARVTRKATYTPRETVDAERLIAWECKKAMNGMKPLEGPIILKMTAWFAPMKAWPKKRPHPLFKSTKPDIDNIVKLVKDALNKIAWFDDAQVVKLIAVKQYSDHGPGISITIDTL